MKGDRMREKRNIRRIIENAGGRYDSQLYSDIATQVRSMKRLWKRKNGKTDLHGRRDAEARLIERSEAPVAVITV